MKLKPLFLILLLGVIHISYAQTATVTIGSRTGCTGRGICTITSTPDPINKATTDRNASIFQTKDEATILRIYRDQLTQEEQDLMLGTPITSKNKNTLLFVMEEALPLPEEIIGTTGITRSKQIHVLEAKTYPTEISDTYIDIIIVEAIKKE